jgi:hypothetical protein
MMTVSIIIRNLKAPKVETASRKGIKLEAPVPAVSAAPVAEGGQV